MKRQPIKRRVQCSAQGCPDFTLYSYSSRREYTEACEKNRPWACCLHNHPKRVLSPSCLKVEWVSPPSARSEEDPTKELYFGSSGVLIDRAYYAEASHFPPGTRIKVTAEVLLPEIPCEISNSGKA